MPFIGRRATLLAVPKVSVSAPSNPVFFDNLLFLSAFVSGLLGLQPQ